MANSSTFPPDGDPFEQRRQRMVSDQLVARGISDAGVLQAMGRVPREEFVPPQFRSMAYEDRPLPIGFGQTISQPYTVAYMTAALELKGAEKVLEIGTGSGYAAAVLAFLAEKVHTVERIPTLARQASQRLARLGLDNAQVHTADGTIGLRREAPFDAIIVTAGAARLPDTYVEQLLEGGRIVIPIGDLPTVQVLKRFTLVDGQVRSEDLGQFAFVPLIGKHSWSSNWCYEG